MLEPGDPPDQQPWLNPTNSCRCAATGGGQAAAPTSQDLCHLRVRDCLGYYHTQKGWRLHRSLLQHREYCVKRGVSGWGDAEVWMATQTHKEIGRHA